MLWALLLLPAAGVALLAVGLWPRRVGAEPRCGRCGFDLSGIELGSDLVCAECGGRLNGPKSIRRGHVSRRWRVAIAGAIALLGPGLLLLTLVTGRYTAWNGAKPIVLLKLDATYGSDAIRDAAADELIFRMKDVSVSDSDKKAISRFAADRVARNGLRDMFWHAPYAIGRDSGWVPEDEIEQVKSRMLALAESMTEYLEPPAPIGVIGFETDAEFGWQYSLEPGEHFFRAPNLVWNDPGWRNSALSIPFNYNSGDRAAELAWGLAEMSHTQYELATTRLASEGLIYNLNIARHEGEDSPGGMELMRQVDKSMRYGWWLGTTYWATGTQHVKVQFGATDALGPTTRIVVREREVFQRYVEPGIALSELPAGTHTFQGVWTVHLSAGDMRANWSSSPGNIYGPIEVEHPVKVVVFGRIEEIIGEANASEASAFAEVIQASQLRVDLSEQDHLAIPQGSSGSDIPASLHFSFATHDGTEPLLPSLPEFVAFYGEITPELDGKPFEVYSKFGMMRRDTECFWMSMDDGLIARQSQRNFFMIPDGIDRVDLRFTPAESIPFNEFADEAAVLGEPIRFVTEPFVIENVPIR